MRKINIEVNRISIWTDRFDGLSLKYADVIGYNFLPANDPHDDYSLADAYLMVSLQTGLPGSTCKLKQTGEKVVPVYEVQCD